MKFSKVLVSALAGTVMASAGAIAADVPVMPVLTPTVVAAPPAPGFDWAGPYVGVNGGAAFCGGYCWGLVGVDAGYNWVSGSMLYGIEAQAGAYLYLGPYVHATARAGYLIGPRALVYAEAGFGAYVPPWGDGLYILGGGGIELAVGERFSVFGEVKAEWVFVHPYVDVRAEGGIHWHIGN